MIRLIRYAANGVVLIAVMAAPFVAYRAIKVASRPNAHPWPASVVLIGSSGDQLTSLSLLRTQPPLRITFPSLSSLELPSGGELRASTVFKIGGAKQVADALMVTLGIDVSYYAHWIGPAGSSAAVRMEPIETDLGSHANDVQAALSSPDLVKLQAPGHVATGTYFSSFVIDAKTVNAELLSKTPQAYATPSPVSPSPAPSPQSTPKPNSISVEVLNQGAHGKAATKMVQLLQQKGFVLASLGTSPTQTVNGNFVYYSQDRRLADVVAAAIGVSAKIAKLPATYKQSVDVLVVLGVPATTTKTSPSPQPS